MPRSFAARSDLVSCMAITARELFGDGSPSGPRNELSVFGCVVVFITSEKTVAVYSRSQFLVTSIIPLSNWTEVFMQVQSVTMTSSFVSQLTLDSSSPYPSLISEHTACGLKEMLFLRNSQHFRISVNATGFHFAYLQSKMLHLGLPRRTYTYAALGNSLSRW